MSRPRPVQPERNNGDRGELGHGQLLRLEKNLLGLDALRQKSVFVAGRFLLSDICGFLVWKKGGLSLCSLGQAALCLA